MPLPIITMQDRRMVRRSAKIVLLGIPGAGKTSQLYTLPASSTLFIDMEAGDLSVQDWQGDALRPRTWREFRDLVVYLAGPSPIAAPDQAYSQAHYEAVCHLYGDPAQLTKYDTYFVDSITVLSRLCLAWAKTQPQAYSERTGKPDMRSAYGLLGSEMMTALTHLQHVRDKHVVFVGILEERLDDFNRRYLGIQLEGNKTGLELPGLIDEVITLALLPDQEANLTTSSNPNHSPALTPLATSLPTPLVRTFVTQANNPWGYPAKDRSGKLAPLEPPDLGRLIAKCVTPHSTTHFGSHHTPEAH